MIYYPLILNPNVAALDAVCMNSPWPEARIAEEKKSTFAQVDTGTQKVILEPANYKAISTDEFLMGYPN